ncbi:MAG TPA: carboxypeptidase-like regulatory domain-containing protein [Chryseosolibacter sp.]
MNRDLTLSIPNRCTQNWNSFTQVEGGGFCSSCSKVVVDFTGMTDKQIIDYFKNVTGETCGRFQPHQLKTFTVHESPRVRPGWMLLKAGFISLSLLAIARPSSAQLPKAKQKTEMPSSYRITQDSITFRGVVTSSDDGSPLPGVNVVLKGSVIGTVTDAEGRFEFPKSLRKDDVLIFSFIGLTTKEYKVDGKKDAGLEVPMQLCMDMDVMGGVQVEGIYVEERRGFWSRLKAFFGA